jgi:hypothetical protein
MKKLRLVIAGILLIISISFLIWGYSPNPRTSLERTIPPAEMQLPTPSSLHFDVGPVS